MSESYRLTIIIPHYNSLELLKKLLSSIPDKKDIQTIVVDDHSSEEIKNQVFKLKTLYKKGELLLLENDTSEHNAGVARNIGLRYAKGDWLLFADADDFFLDGFYTAIKKYFDTDYDIVFFPPISVQLDTGKRDSRAESYYDFVMAYSKNPNKINSNALRYRWGVPWSKLMKRSFVQINNISFDSVRLHNDEMFSCKAGFYAQKITACTDIIYCVTRSKGSLTTKMDLESFSIQTDVDISIFKFLRTNLSKEDFKSTEEYKYPYLRLQLILRRKYGWRVLLKYIKIFWKNRMFVFDKRLFTCIRPWRWIRARHDEKEMREHYGTDGYEK